jgi:dual specificity phosphatase 12
MGVSRSATVVVAYLMRTYHWTLDTALAFVKESRKVEPNKNFVEQLKVWEEVEYEIWEDPERTIPKPAYAAYLQRRAERLRELGLTGDEPILPVF